MVSQRNRIVELKQYLQSIGIDINIGKNKARGHKGFFMHKCGEYRIDISKNLSDENIISVLLHEYAHYLHYSYDKNLKSLDFIFGDFNDEIREELIRVTVQDVPKDFAKSLYNKKNNLSNEIKDLELKIKKIYPDFKLSERNKLIEKDFSLPLKYLLKYDRVKILNKLYSIEKLDFDFDLDCVQKNYILLKSRQRFLRRINSKINKLNKYYNNPSELFARFVESFFTKPEEVKKMAPSAYRKFSEINIPQLKKIELIING